MKKCNRKRQIFAFFDVKCKLKYAGISKKTVSRLKVDKNFLSAILS